jgi:uncharacterized membrane protein YhiD involved in acid resistance
MYRLMGIRCVTNVLLLVLLFAIVDARAQQKTDSGAAAVASRVAPPAIAGEGTDAPAASKNTKAQKSVFAEDGPVDTSGGAQLESLRHALVRLPLAAALSAMLAFRPRRRGTPKRQAPVIQTQIILAIVGATVMLVVGASLARAFGIVGAAGLIRYRAKVEDPKDAGVMLSTLAVGLASGVGLYVFAGFAAAFVLLVLLIVESFDPEPYSLFELALATKGASNMKESVEGVLRRRDIHFELRGASEDEISYEVKLPLDLHTDKVSQALMSLKAPEPVNVKWETKKAK